MRIIVFFVLAITFAGCSRSARTIDTAPALGSVTKGVVVDLAGNGVDLQDMELPASVADRLYTLEFDFSGQAQLRVFSLSSSGLVTRLHTIDLSLVLSGSLANDLSIISKSSAVVVAQAPVGGTGGSESLYAFDPSQAAPSVSSHDVGADSLVAPFVDMTGDTLTLISMQGDTVNKVGLTLLEDAVYTSSRLYAVTSNVTYGQTATTRHPGTIHVYGFDPATNLILSRQGVLYTGKSGSTASGVYNPVKLKIATISNREVLIVACAGSFNNDGAVEVFDLATHETLVSRAVYGSPMTDIAVDSDNGFIYVGDAMKSRVHCLKLDLSAQAPTLTVVAGSPFIVPDGGGSDTWSVAGLGVSSDGSRLSAINYKSSYLTIFSLSQGQPTALVSTSAIHDTLSTSTPQRAVILKVRAGIGGADFTGPDVFFGLIDVDTTARVLPDVGSVIDSAYSY